MTQQYVPQILDSRKLLLMEMEISSLDFLKHHNANDSKNQKHFIFKMHTITHLQPSKWLWVQKNRFSMENHISRFFGYTTNIRTAHFPFVSYVTW